jgi:hypothetical protein
MRINASPEAISFITERGGRVFVWATVHGCCRGMRYTVLDADTHPPARPMRPFERIDGEYFTVFLSVGNRLPPEELVVEMRGRWRRRVEAFWNGCFFVA